MKQAEGNASRQSVQSAPGRPPRSSTAAVDGGSPLPPSTTNRLVPRSSLTAPTAAAQGSVAVGGRRVSSAAAVSPSTLSATVNAPATFRSSLTMPINEWTPEAAKPENDPTVAAASVAAQKRAKSSRVTVLRDPALNAEVAGGLKARTSMSQNRRSSTAGGNNAFSSLTSKYRSRRQLTGRGDCPPDQNYLEAPFVESARRTGRYIHACWLDQVMCDVVLQTVDGELLAHRIILAAVSATLDALFRQKPPDDDPKLAWVINLLEFQRETVADVINFAYTGSLELDCKNIGPVTACSKELDFGIVVRICDDYLISQCDPDNIILHYSVAANNDLIDTRDRLLGVICDAFPETCKNRHFPYLPYDRLLAILSNSSLCVTDEMDVFNAIVCWVDANRADRLPVACRLLPFVRFQLIPPDELAQHVQAIDWMFGNRDCMEPIWDAYKYHALSMAGSPAVRCMDLQSQRDCVQNGSEAGGAPGATGAVPAGGSMGSL